LIVAKPAGPALLFARRQGTRKAICPITLQGPTYLKGQADKPTY
jgi:hypothetical protein